MKENKPESAQPNDLRRRAEELLGKKKLQDIGKMTGADIRSSIHELQVHQIELEILNDELKRAHTETEKSLKKYFDFYNFAPVGYFKLDEKETILEVNQTGSAMLGIERISLIKRRFRCFVEPVSVTKFNSFFRRLLETGTEQTCELRLVSNARTPFYVRISGMVVSNYDGGNGKQCQIAIMDITHLKETEDAQSRLIAILDSTTDFVGMAEAKGHHVIYVNRGGRKMMGIGEDEDISTTTISDYHPQWMNTLLANKAIPTAIRDGYWTGEGSFLSRDGREIPTSMIVLAHKSPDGSVIYFSTISRDITERKQMEEKLRKLSMVIEQSVNIVFITDVNGNIEYVNPMFEQVTGYRKEEAIGQNPRILASGETTRLEYEELWKTITAGKTWRGVFKNRKKNGQYYWGNGLISPIRDEKGQVTHFLAVQEDITKRKISEERAQYLASYDELTGLFNRACFIGLLNERLSHDKNHNQTGVLLLINIDRFRLINDMYGHSVGDTVLRHIAGFLRNTLFEIDKQCVNKEKKESILGHMGGDEFAIFLPSRSEKEGMAAAECICKKLEDHRFIEITGRLTATIGIVIYPRHGVTTHNLFTKADSALYHAKELGRNRSHLYHPEDRIIEKMRSRITWREFIQKAITENRFEPWFQPILDLNDNKIHHYEALARIRDKDGKIILPGVFVDVAEEFGLITAIDRTISEKTIKYQAALKKRGAVFSFSINLSGKDFGGEELLEYLKSAIAGTGAEPKHLVFEITETAAVREYDRAVKFIKALKSLGCCFSLDDFGVGFTSFKYLSEMEVDYIKIDGSFIRNLHESKNNRLFVKAVVDVAKGMGIKTIAEFVEKEEIIKILKELGVDYAQGYFIGKPVPKIL